MGVLRKIQCVCVLALLVISSVDCLKILAIFPYIGKSHHYVFDPLINELAAKGHEVTIVSHFPSEQPINNRIDIPLITDMASSEHAINLTELESIPKFLGMVQVAFESEFLYSFGVQMCNLLLENDGVQNLLKQGKRFDVALVEQFNSDCLLGIVHKFGIPTVGITSDTMLPWHFHKMGAITNPSHIPCHNLGYGTKPIFWQRVSSFLVCGMMRFGYRLMSEMPTHDLLVKHLGKDVPSMEELNKNISLLLVNAYFPLHGAFLLGPNIREIGGLFLKKSIELPKDLEEYINDSPHGVVYFSFGSMIKGTSISKEKLTAIQQAFSEIPQRVLWKWENDSMPGIPNNVMVRRWLPQLDILSHSNVKAFITHGGMLSTTEAAHCGVPVISVPLFGDQFANAAAAEESGLGTILLYDSITKETMLQALRKVLDPKIQQSAKRLSAIWKDRPQTPLETAVYWIEHVARHGGDHLRPVSADLPLYQYLLLDVLAFLGLVLFIAIYVTYKILACYFRLFFGSKSKSKTE